LFSSFAYFFAISEFDVAEPGARKHLAHGIQETSIGFG
jgi:hypothetical protein